jgi:hypothetical protein
MAYNIVKLENGNIALYDSTTTDFIKALSPDYVEIECNVNGVVKLIQDNGNVEYFVPADVDNTQILPAAAIAFSGSCADLAELLATDFFFEVSGGGGVAVYQQSLFTSFQRSAKTLTTLGIGSNSSTAVGFVVDEKVRILNSSIEITSFIAGIGTFSIHKVENGLVTERLFTTGSYSIAANGVYTFVTNLDLEPGIYAYIVQQTVIQTYRAFALPDNVFGVQSTMGTTTFINTKTSIQVGIPDPFPVGQANGTGNAPLAIFEIQMI